MSDFYKDIEEKRKSFRDMIKRGRERLDLLEEQLNEKNKIIKEDFEELSVIVKEIEEKKD